MHALPRLAGIAASIAAVWLAFATFTIYKNARALQLSGSDLVTLAATTYIYALLRAGFTPVVVYAAQRRRRPLLIGLATLLFAVAPFVLYAALLAPDTLRELTTTHRMELLSRGADNMVFALAIVLVVRYQQTTRANAEARRAEAALAGEVARAQLQQLRADLHPHFLFNSISAVAALLRSDPARAKQMLKVLGELLQRSFAWMDTRITLGEEVSFVERYLQVQQMRFGERLSVAIDIPAALRDALVPPLILQPLVENAVVHGIAPLAAPGTVRVSAHADGDRLRLAVRDTGRGFSGTIDGHDSIGIPNTVARLRLMYGDTQPVRFAREHDGFSATVTLPLQVAGARI